ncbi:MAG: SRPBCC family protein [Candidatus Anammoxibacter sp.]
MKITENKVVGTEAVAVSLLKVLGIAAIAITLFTGFNTVSAENGGDCNYCSKTKSSAESLSDFSKNIIINASAEDVWQTVSDIGGIQKYLPMIAHVNVEGSGVGAKRTCTMADGSQIFEKIITFNKDKKILRYIVTKSQMPFKNYVGTFKVQSISNNQCQLEWSSTFIPRGMREDEVKKMLNGIYTVGLEGIKKLHEV